MSNSTKSIAIYAAAGLLAASLTWAQGASLSVEGNTNYYTGTGGSAPPATIGNVSGYSANGQSTEIPAFQYSPPTSFDSGYPASTLNAATLDTGGGTVTRSFTGNQTITGATWTVKGGGLVQLHVSGDLNLDHVTINIQDGTRLVFFVDGNVTSSWSQFLQWGGASVQIQSGGDVTIHTDRFVGAAFANLKLTLQSQLVSGNVYGSMTNKIKFDASLASANQEGNVRRLRILPIVEGQ